MNELHAHELLAVSRRVAAAIEKYSVERLTGEHRDHLGASVIGHDCAAHIWYHFRWALREPFTGRMLRLFETGHLQEQRFIDDLRGIGWQIWDRDASGNQFRITGSQGHYGGSSDSVGLAPFELYPELQGQPLLVEYKTHNEKSYKALKKDMLVVAKPRHYAQMCAYGQEFGFKYGLYCAKNKDTDENHFEVVKLDARHADDLRRKADDIIFSRYRPPKISLQPEHFECKFCAFAGICHKQHPVEKNCRSCDNVQPVANAQWRCNLNGLIIPPEVIKVGCPSHIGIK